MINNPWSPHAAYAFYAFFYSDPNPPRKNCETERDLSHFFCSPFFLARPRKKSLPLPPPPPPTPFSCNLNALVDGGRK